AENKVRLRDCRRHSRRNIPCSADSCKRKSVLTGTAQSLSNAPAPHSEEPRPHPLRRTIVLLRIRWVSRRIGADDFMVAKMKKGLRSRLARYGDEEFALFLRRGFLKGAGFTDEALDRPIIGVLSTASDFNPCHKTAPQVAEAVSRGVRMAGG